MIKNIISLIIVAILLFFGYLVFIEKRSFSDILEIGKETVEDKSLELKVESQIKFNKNFENAQISAEAEDGEITLNGTVGSIEKAVLAAQIANNVVGVTRVINKLKVSAEIDEVSSGGRSEREKLLDEELMKKAEAILSTAEGLEDVKIRVTAFKRVLFLEGKVRSESQKDLAVRLIRSIEKVRDVKEELTSGIN